MGDITYLGERDYSIRAWLDPQKLASRSITASEVATAIQQQNAGRGPGPGRPAAGAAAGRHSSCRPTRWAGWNEPEQFGDIIVKAIPGGRAGEAARFVRLSDVARVEMGPRNYNHFSSVDGMPSVALAIYQLARHQRPGRRQAASAPRWPNCKKRFPDGLDYGIYYDTTPFIRESVGRRRQDAA